MSQNQLSWLCWGGFLWKTDDCLGENERKTERYADTNTETQKDRRKREEIEQDRARARRMPEKKEWMLCQNDEHVLVCVVCSDGTDTCQGRRKNYKLYAGSGGERSEIDIETETCRYHMRER